MVETLLDSLSPGYATVSIYRLVAIGCTLLCQTSADINFAARRVSSGCRPSDARAMQCGMRVLAGVLVGRSMSLVLLALGFSDAASRAHAAPRGAALATHHGRSPRHQGRLSILHAEASPFPSIVPAGDVDFSARVPPPWRFRCRASALHRRHPSR